MYCYANSGGKGRYIERRAQPPADPSKERRAVVCVDSGEVYWNVTQAASVYRCAPKTVRDCCEGKRERAGGQRWEWSEPGKLWQEKSGILAVLPFQL